MWSFGRKKTRIIRAEGTEFVVLLLLKLLQQTSVIVIVITTITITTRKTLELSAIIVEKL